MNLLDIYKELNTEEKCLAFLEDMRWPNGVKCLACESLRISRITAKGKLRKKTGKRSPDRKLYQCNDCRFQFTATTGTVYHDTHLPLCKWFLAIALITESKKGISANSTGPRPRSPVSDGMVSRAPHPQSHGRSESAQTHGHG